MAVFFLFLRNVLLQIEILKIKIPEHSDPPSQHFSVRKAFSHFFFRRGKVILCHPAEWHKNISLSLHNSFCLNRESKVKRLPNQVKRLQEQREWMRSYEQLKAWEEIVISSDDEEALLRQITVSNISGSGTSRAKNTR